MEIIENKALVFRTRDPDKYNIIPRSKVVGENNGVYEMAVFWGLEEVRVLRNLGVKDLQSPITARYNWPGRHKPFAHQIETASFLTLNPKAFVFNDPGTGKTLSALWAADYLMRLKKVRRCLILCPLSIMHDAWMSGISNSIIHRSAIVAHHTQASRRIEMVQGDYEFVIVNYDGLNLIAEEVARDGRFDLVIVDEANAYKNSSTKRWKSLNKIIRPDSLLWMMTGTPSAQSPVDAYGLAKLVNPSGVPKFATAWRDKVMKKLTQFKWVPKSGAAEAVFAALQPAIRFTKEECTDLPPVLTETREIPLTPQQLKYYKLLKERMVMQASGETITAVNAAAGVSKLLQISAGAAYTDAHEVVEFDCAPRLNVLLEVLQETNRKVIVFAPFRHSIETIHEFLLKHNIGAEVIHGDVSVNKRTDIFKRFQTEPNPRILVVQPQSASHGVTLTAADTVVFYGPVMSVETYLQCIARADRIGQTSTNVTVIHLQGSDIEKRMFAQLEKRVEGHDILLNLYKEEIGEI
jgi:superfamily II DNA or RNA helicase